MTKILDRCYFPALILILEEAPYVGKFYVLFTVMFFLVVDVDKKIMFHNILAMEYLMKNKNYSNTDYFFNTCMSIIIFTLAFLWTFMGPAFRMFSSSANMQRV